MGLAAGARVVQGDVMDDFFKRRSIDAAEANPNYSGSFVGGHKYGGLAIGGPRFGVVVSAPGHNPVAMMSQRQEQEEDWDRQVEHDKFMANLRHQNAMKRAAASRGPAPKTPQEELDEKTAFLLANHPLNTNDNPDDDIDTLPDDLKYSLLGLEAPKPETFDPGDLVNMPGGGFGRVETGPNGVPFILPVEGGEAPDPGPEKPDFKILFDKDGKEHPFDMNNPMEAAAYGAALSSGNFSTEKSVAPNISKIYNVTNDKTGDTFQVGPDRVAEYLGADSGYTVSDVKTVTDKVPESTAARLALQDRAISGLKKIDNLYESAKDNQFLTYGGRLKGQGLATLERFGFEPSEENKQYLRDLTEFQVATLDFLNQYVKEITGAQMTNAEAVRIMASVPNISMSESQFEGALRDTKRRAQDIINQRRRDAGQQAFDWTATDDFDWGSIGLD